MSSSDSPSSELIAARDWDQLCKRLCSRKYVLTKIETGRIYDLIREYNAAAASIPPDHSLFGVVAVLGSALRLSATFIARHPDGRISMFMEFVLVG